MPHRKNKPPRPFPWEEVMAFGLGRLRLAPRDFWALSLPELAGAMQSTNPRLAVPVTRQWLSEAMQRFPDTAQAEPGEGQKPAIPNAKV